MAMNELGVMPGQWCFSTTFGSVSSKFLMGNIACRGSRDAMHRAPLSLADIQAEGLLSPGLENFPISTSSNFPLPSPIPRSPSCRPTALRCAARPIRSSGALRA